MQLLGALGRLTLASNAHEQREGAGRAAKQKIPAGAKERRAMFEGERVAHPTPPAELLKQGDVENHPVNSLCEASQFVRSDPPEKAKVI